MRQSCNTVSILPPITHELGRNELTWSPEVGVVLSSLHLGTIPLAFVCLHFPAGFFIHVGAKGSMLFLPVLLCEWYSWVPGCQGNLDRVVY